MIRPPSIETATLVNRRFGSGLRIALNEFIVFGLLSCWIYSVIRMYSALSEHMSLRWRELSVNLESVPSTDEFYRQGFSTKRTLPILAGCLFAMCAVTVGWWFTTWIWIGSSIDYFTVVAEVGASSTMFYVATVITFVWILRIIRAHEIRELMLLRLGQAAIENIDLAPSNEVVDRWAQQTNAITLFLIIALPIAFSPTIGAHLFLTGATVSYGVWPPTLCFVLALIFHIWGTSLLVGLFNSHLQFEHETKRSEICVDDEEPSAAISEHLSQDETEDSAPQRLLAAIMLTDMVGYSRSMEMDERATYAKLIQHNAILRAAVKNHRGREIKTIGDSFLVLFSSAADSVECAIAIQHSLADFNISKNVADQIIIRIGLHLGDVLVTKHDVFGDGVNVVARIEPLAEPGGICMSQEVFELVKKRIELVVDRIEGVKLKNIAVAPEIYRIRLS